VLDEERVEDDDGPIQAARPAISAPKNDRRPPPRTSSVMTPTGTVLFIAIRDERQGHRNEFVPDRVKAKIPAEIVGNGELQRDLESGSQPASAIDQGASFEPHRGSSEVPMSSHVQNG